MTPSNKYGLYLLLGFIIYNLIDYISICTDAELFISFCGIIYIYIYIYIAVYIYIYSYTIYSLKSIILIYLNIVNIEYWCAMKLRSQYMKFIILPIKWLFAS